MSLFLGIDTATIAVSTAIVRDGTVLAHFSCAGARHQTETLHPAIDLCFAASGVSPTDLDGVVADVGPGRFTGVRVGLAAAKALAFAAGVPVTGFSSAELLLAAVEGEGDAVAVVDLRRGEVATCSSDDPTRALIRTTPADLGRALADRPGEWPILVGDGAVEYAAAIAAAAGREPRIVRDPIAPSAIVACRLAERSATPVDPIALAAVYLRGADVGLGWETRDRAAHPTRLEVG